MKKNANKEEVERGLLLRLKWMSFVFFLLAIGALLVATLAPKITTEEFEAIVRLQKRLFGDVGHYERPAHEVLNFYVVAAVFICIGLSLFLLFWKKSKSLLKPNGEEE